jgi:hypothetical protein
LYENIGLQRIKREKLRIAAVLRSKQLKRKCLKRIHEFSKMRDKKLESIKMVHAYYNKKMLVKVLVALRQNADDCLAKDAHIKKAL